jgi:glycosyltransferase
MKISVITAVFNRVATVEDAINSVQSQSGEIEYLTVDGMSSDGTSAAIEKHSSSIDRCIREPDQGIYDALNKGIENSTGDVIGFLHADDILASQSVIEHVRTKFETGDYDAVYGDLVYVRSENADKVTRFWKAGAYDRRKFRWGWMPPHPTVYIRKEIYEKFGGYRTDIGSGADYECMVRLMYRHNIRVGYIPKILVKMRVGGESNASIGNRVNANEADRQAWLQNELAPPFGIRFTKPLSKIPQFFTRPKANPK